MRVRACVILVHDNRVALIERVRDGDRYWVLPGGAVEAGETLEGAAAREALEELGITVRILRSVLSVPDPESGRPTYALFLAGTDSPTFGEMTGPELVRQSPTNSYRRQWVPLGEVAGLNLVPMQAKDLLVAISRGGDWPRDIPQQSPGQLYPPPAGGTSLIGGRLFGRRL